MSFFYCFLVVAVNVFCVFARMSTKCLVLEEASPYPVFSIQKSHLCPRSQLTAACLNVSDLALELSIVPRAINVLCVWVGYGSTLQPNVLTKFHSLRSMYIYGCLSAILPEAFRGLSNLHLLSMACPERCKTSVPSEVFNDLHILEELNLQNYTLSEMASDNFDGLSHMKRLDVKGYDDFSELLCKLLYFSASLQYLSIEMDAESLTTPDCKYGSSKFPSLRGVMFSFPHVKKIETNAFRYLDKISFLNMPMNDVLQTQLLHSGIQQLDQMQFSQKEINIKSMCEIVFALSVTHISFHVNALQESSESSWEKCYKLEEITLEGQNLTNVDLSFISTLKYLRIFCFKTYGQANTRKEDRSLVSLCKNHVSLSSLRDFRFRTGQGLTLRTNQFICLSHLENLDLSGRYIQLEDFAFEGLFNLQNLSLQALKSGPPEMKARYLTSGPGLMNLTSLNLSFGRNSTIEDFAFKRLTGLLTLRVDANVFVIKPELFSGLENVEELLLERCFIQTIKDFAFTNLSKLRHMDLTGNQISAITTNTFFGLQNLEIFIIENNPLRHFEVSSFAHFPSLRVLHLGNLMFSTSEHSGIHVLNLSLIFGGFPHQLSELTIKSAVRPMTLVIADDSVPDVGLSLSLSGQKIVLWGCEKRFLKSVTKLQVEAEFFLCAPDYTVAISHFTSVVFLLFSQWHVSTVQNLSGLNRLLHLRRLDLINVNFVNQPDMSLMFHNFTKLESLSLYRCWLDSLEGDLSVDMTSLKYFFLVQEAEISLTKDFFEHLTSLKFAIIYQAQLRCTCDDAWFLRWARNQQQAEVFMFSNEKDPLRCISEGGLQNLDSFGQAHCSLDVGFVFFVSTSCFLLLFMLVVLLHQLARDYLLAFYYITHGWFNEALRHQNTRGRYLYDAFVSYSGRDERWVMEQLLPKLEQRGPPFLRLCLHSRDFQLGKDIVENITDSLYKSRRTLCLVSRHFLRSNWCSLEMRLGTYRLQVEHRDVLILVFLEKIPSNLLSAHHRLARLVKTRTYIDWPQDPAQQEAFWDRLWNKLVTDKVL